MKKIEFLEVFNQYSFKDCIAEIESKAKEDVETSLHKAYKKNNLNFQNYLSLISPASDSYLEAMASLSKEITQERFGKTIQLYMPMYLSNECRSSCLYCGFSFENKIKRKTLSFSEIRRESEILKNKGIEHILILTGEDYSKTSISYLLEAVKILKEYFSSISIEIYPMDVDDYKKLIERGVDGLTLYQETYDKEIYKKYHLRGVKKNMEYRLNGPDRGGFAGFRKIGIGALLGLAETLGELYFLGLHLDHLYKNYWQSFMQVSLPRMRPAEGEFNSVIPVNDREFLKYIFALRIYFPDLGIALSTREGIKLRDNLIGLGITTMSAESKTEPGGYSGSGELEQFETEDKRTLQEIVNVIRRKGLDPVLKDFDRALI